MQSKGMNFVTFNDKAFKYCIYIYIYVIILNNKLNIANCEYFINRKLCYRHFSLLLIKMLKLLLLNDN